MKSNAESGEGYCDISVEVEDKEIGIIIELNNSIVVKISFYRINVMGDKAGKKYKRRLTGDFINIRTGGFIWDFL